MNEPNMNEASMIASRANVTVVVPTMNEADGIGRFLSSLPSGVKLIVVDSSTDATPEIIASIRPQAEVITTMVNIPTARQIGADAAATEWILFTDADVVFEVGFFDRLADLRLDERVGGIVGAKSTISGFDNYHRWFVRGQRALHSVGIPAASGSNMLIRRSALAAVGGFDPALTVNEDSEIMFRIARSGWQVPFVPHLRVLSFDHRRLEIGVGRKFVHGAVRNTALYLGMFGKLVRRSDWGYWNDEPAPVPS